MAALLEIGRNAKRIESVMRNLKTEIKNKVLTEAAKSLEENADMLIQANALDMKAARENQMREAMQDRLLLTRERIAGMADGLRKIADLEDPIGEVLQMKKRPNGLIIGNKRVPIGVIGMIYEARPNVTSDAFGLCFKTGNAVILKGGSDAIHSNKAVTSCIQDTLKKEGLPGECVQLIEDTNRETTLEFMKMNGYVDLLIPRGGAGLIKSVVENSSIPVIETGTGNCHVYVDETADLDMAVSIVINAKTQRVSVCNACESLVIHKDIADAFLTKLKKAMADCPFTVYGDDKVRAVMKEALEATEEDYGKEYLDYQLSAKVVNSFDEAVMHINRYNTGHSEAIVTKDYGHAQRFLEEIDAACVYVNASTRFTDGYEFGYGAELGISTQKLHVRGPMGLLALTSNKYVIYGNGQIRK